MDNDPPRPPAPVSLRLTPSARAALDALAAAVAPSRVHRHRLAVIALEHGARVLAADPRAVARLRGLDAENLLDALGTASPASPALPVSPAAPVVQPTTPAHGGSTPVVGRSAPVHPAATPATHPRAATERARPGARGDASGAEVDAMLQALRGAVERGASINALAAAAGMTGGGTRRRLSSLLAGERPPVSVQLARTITAAAEKHGR